MPDRSLLLHGVSCDLLVAFRLAEGTQLIGRGESNDIRLPHPSVSRRHAELTVTDDHITIRDLGSANGTYVDVARVRFSNIGPGQWLTFGHVSLRLTASLAEDEERGESARRPETKRAAVAPTWRLRSSNLPPDELALFEMLVSDHSDAIIAEELELAPERLEAKARAVCRLFGVRNRAELTLWAHDYDDDEEFGADQLP